MRQELEKKMGLIKNTFSFPFQAQMDAERKRKVISEWNRWRWRSKGKVRKREVNQAQSLFLGLSSTTL